MDDGNKSPIVTKVSNEVSEQSRGIYTYIIITLLIKNNNYCNYYTRRQGCIGIMILRPQARFSARKKTYLNLTSRLKRGRPKSYWKYRNRVGQKADALCKVKINDLIIWTL